MSKYRDWEAEMAEAREMNRVEAAKNDAAFRAELAGLLRDAVSFVTACQFDDCEDPKCILSKRLRAMLARLEPPK